MAAPPNIRVQAAQAADSAVPTVGSIYKQYGQSMSDAGGFTEALMHLLGQQPGLGAAYNSAISEQQGVDTAGANRIAAVTGGMPTAASSGAVVGGLADSALSHLIANQGAAKAYGAQLPVAAAARGALENQSLITARNAALQTRSQERTQAFNSALGQAQQNALALREFNVNTGLKQQSMALQAQNDQAMNAYRYAALGQNRSEFNQRQAQAWQVHLDTLKAQIGNGSAAGLQGYTPSEISNLENRASTAANLQGLHGVPIQVGIRNLVAQGIPRAIALAEVQNAYAQLTRPTKDAFTSKAGTPTATYNGAAYQAATRAYKTAVASFRAWVNQRQFNQALKASRFRKSPPGHPE